MPGTLAISDNQLATSNTKFFMHANQRYEHNGVAVAAPGSTTTTWGSNIFYRWSFVAPTLLPNVCVDTTLVSCPTGPGGLRLPEDAGQASDPRYRVYPNAAIENRFTLKPGQS